MSRQRVGGEGVHGGCNCCHGCGDDVSDLAVEYDDEQALAGVEESPVSALVPVCRYGTSVRIRTEVYLLYTYIPCVPTPSFTHKFFPSSFICTCISIWFFLPAPLLLLFFLCTYLHCSPILVVPSTRLHTIGMTWKENDGGEARGRRQKVE